MKTATPKRILRYINHFGVRAGLEAARMHTSTDSIVTIRLPGLLHRLNARSGTSDAVTFEEVFLTRQYEIPFSNFNPTTILDLGANVGYASVYFASRWPGAEILAVEPSPENIQLLKANIAPWAKISYVQAAVWSHPTTVRISNPSDAANAYQMKESTDILVDSVPAYTVNQFLERLGSDRLDLLKMDVEGAELEVFRGDTSWLDRVGILVVELHDRIMPGCAEALYTALRGRHFQQEIAGSNLFIDLR